MLSDVPLGRSLVGGLRAVAARVEREESNTLKQIGIKPMHQAAAATMITFDALVKSAPVFNGERMRMVLDRAEMIGTAVEGIDSAVLQRDAAEFLRECMVSAVPPDADTEALVFVLALVMVGDGAAFPVGGDSG
uniref:Uncharacterized protein n=1 Tax=Chromera velia CCMP2878 TaxID=1169474 RepID=A0A0G4HRX5_9ALVE|eukprot:Cvel_8182.t1-p1 / transcript=Cvel_8182.t1 / gene=Cvel_8182 / organism=Chromera_velia_CCMP2878 / gene_product=hypothetical protein / transcript_product=hypothetical protein / location=Cvel_scaffold446:13470-13868(-) / protein_length=133 / sequence_SO=supercontig / SO=protein_coding / is_pseudo=false